MLSHPLTIGKLRGLQELTNAQGVFTMLAIDHRGSLRKALDPNLPAQVSPETLIDFKLLMTRILAPLASAVLLDPVYGAAQAVGAGVLPGQIGLIVSLEASGYEGEATARRTPLIPGWSVAQIKRMGASAVKLLLYYHPEASTARDQEDLVRAVATDCRQHDIPFLLEPMSFSLDPSGAPKGSVAFARTRPRIVYDSALHLVPMGVDVLKAEFPADLQYESDAEALSHCRRLTDALRVPWVLLSAAADYALFRRQVEIACRGGAAGFLVGRAVWQEMARLRREEWEEFAAITAADRLRTLCDIANSEAQPYQPVLTVPPDWIESYAAEPALARV
jgi:tagatose 1,6-diphosphate aldolase